MDPEWRIPAFKKPFRVPGFIDSEFVAACGKPMLSDSSVRRHQGKCYACREVVERA